MEEQSLGIIHSRLLGEKLVLDSALYFVLLDLVYASSIMVNLSVYTHKTGETSESKVTDSADFKPTCSWASMAMEGWRTRCLLS